MEIKGSALPDGTFQKGKQYGLKRVSPDETAVCLMEEITGPKGGKKMVIGDEEVVRIPFDVLWGTLKLSGLEWTGAGPGKPNYWRYVGTTEQQTLL